MAGGAGRRGAAGHAANAGTNTSGAGGLYPIEASALDDDLGLAQSVEALAWDRCRADHGGKIHGNEKASIFQSVSFRQGQQACLRLPA